MTRKNDWLEQAQRLDSLKRNASRRDGDDLPTSISASEARAQSAATQRAWNASGAPVKNGDDLSARIAKIIAKQPHRRATDPDVIEEASRSDSRSDSRTDSLAPRHTYDPKTGTGFDARPWVMLADGRKVPAAVADGLRNDSTAGERVQRTTTRERIK